MFCISLHKLFLKISGTKLWSILISNIIFFVNKRMERAETSANKTVNNAEDIENKLWT